MLELVRYEELAKLFHPELVNKLHNAATVIVRYCRFDSPFVPDDFQLACLQRLANGEHYADIANHMRYSKRQIQRKLTDLWNQLGVDNPTQGLAIAVEQGWVTIPRDTNQ
ncbi:helix-turn-helix domain-containing protein [Candidatus Poriferisocius sp.]|uniref:helix-turn-helix domain-containing protein n=1 Tax=Candidatus Poriferisocius sp. TaxID=3101276 RepID=UPI003B011B0F